MAASAPPILWSVVEFIRVRKVDAIAILVLTGIALSLMAFAGGGGVKFLQLRENLVTGLVGLIFLGSVIIGRPLIYQLVRAGLEAPGCRTRRSLFEAQGDNPAFRRAMVVISLGWAIGLLGGQRDQLRPGLLRLSIQQFLIVSGPITYASMGLLTVWTSVYMRRVMTAAAAREGL